MAARVLTHSSRALNSSNEDQVTLAPLALCGLREVLRRELVQHRGIEVCEGCKGRVCHARSIHDDFFRFGNLGEFTGFYRQKGQFYRDLPVFMLDNVFI
jgi:hypothetical protein